MPGRTKRFIGIEKEREEQIYKFHLRAETKIRDQISLKQGELKRKLERYGELMEQTRINDTDLGIDSAAGEKFIEEVESDFGIILFSNRVGEYVPKPTDFKEVESGSDVYRLQSLIIATLSKTPLTKYINLSDTYHVGRIEETALKLLNKHGGDVKEGRIAYFIALAHDLAKSREVRKALGDKDPLQWLEDESSIKWIKEYLDPLPTRLDDDRIHSLVSAQLALKIQQGLDREECQEVYNGIVTHDYAWAVGKGLVTEKLGRPRYLSGKCVHDADKLERVREIDVETPLYAIREGMTLERMIEIANQNVASLLIHGGYLLKELNSPSLIKRQNAYAAASLKYLQIGLELEGGKSREGIIQ